MEKCRTSNAGSLNRVAIVLALGVTACTPMLVSTQQGGTVHDVDPFNQSRAFELARENCAMSGMALRIVTFPSIRGDLTFLCVRS